MEPTGGEYETVLILEGVEPSFNLISSENNIFTDPESVEILTEFEVN
jgi:hypothetical protein